MNESNNINGNNAKSTITLVENVISAFSLL